MNNTTILLVLLFLLQIVFLTIVVFGVRKAIWESRIAAKAAKTSARTSSLNATQQMEYLDGLYLRLGWERGTLPPTRGYSGSPDFLTILYDHTKSIKPEVIVDCGSGLTTIVLARCLEQLGKGRILALDHDPVYGAKTQGMLKDLGLADYAQVHIAPLREQEIGGRKGFWYDLEDVVLPERIDLAVVDGPPMPLVGHEGRYPAGPVLYPHLAVGGCIILDDTNRPGEQAIVQKWERDFPDTKKTVLLLEKGCVLLTKGTA